MASIGLHSSGPLLAPIFARRLFMSAFAIPSLLAQRPWSYSTPTLQSLLDLIPPFLLAVPKKKTSHSRKAMRSANKGLKDKQNIVSCPACGSPKLAHHLCPNCYSALSRKWKMDAKQGGDSRYAGIPEVHARGEES